MLDNQKNIEVLGNFAFPSVMPIPTMDVLPIDIDYPSIVSVGGSFYSNTLADGEWGWKLVDGKIISEDELNAIYARVATMLSVAITNDISQLINTSIGAQVPTIALNTINTNVPSMINDAIAAQVPGLAATVVASIVPSMISDGIAADVPALISAAITALVPGMISDGIAADVPTLINTAIIAQVPLLIDTAKTAILAEVTTMIATAIADNVPESHDQYLTVDSTIDCGILPPPS